MRGSPSNQLFIYQAGACKGPVARGNSPGYGNNGVVAGNLQPIPSVSPNLVSRGTGGWYGYSSQTKRRWVGGILGNGGSSYQQQPSKSRVNPA